MNCEAAGRLLIDHVEGSSGPLPSSLQEHIDSCATCSLELAEMRDTWSLLGNLDAEESTPWMRTRFDSMLEAQGAGGRSFFHWWPPRPAFQAALMAAMLVIGVLLGSNLSQDATDREAIRDLQAQMQTMARAVTLSLLEHQSASERIRAVGMTEGSNPDGQIVDALLKVVNEDPSVNVRLAALDVLEGISQRPEVREGILDSFHRQDSVLMQAAMVDVLLAIDGPRSRDEILKAMEGDQLPDSVRDYLQHALNDGGKGI